MPPRGTAELSGWLSGFLLRLTPAWEGSMLKHRSRGERDGRTGAGEPAAFRAGSGG